MKISYIALLILFFSPFIFASNGTLSGTGHQDSPYLIEDFADFTEYCSDPNYWEANIHTRLEADIDLNPTLPGRVIYDRAPIAPDTDDESYYFNGYQFKGNFDGNYHTISNLQINGVSYFGLFGYTGSGSSISNLGVINANLTGKTAIGLIVGDSRSAISNCFSTGTITTNGSGGGLVGHNYRIISNCYSSCDVTGSTNLGGLVGVNYSLIYDSYATGTVTATSLYVGGLVGMNFCGDIIRCFATGLVDCSKSTADGLAGASVSANGSIAIIQDCFWDVNTTGKPDRGRYSGVVGLTTSQMQNRINFVNANWDFNAEDDNGSSDLWHMPHNSTGYPMLFFQRDIPGDTISGYGVDIHDFAAFAQDWLKSNDLQELIKLAQNWLVGI